MVDVRDVHYAVGGRAIFSGLTLQARRGRITAVMGPSGTGKTTLLRLITAQSYADRGQVLVWGRDVAQLSSREVFAMRGRMGMLFQNGALLTVLEHIEIGAIHGQSSTVDTRRPTRGLRRAPPPELGAKDSKSSARSALRLEPRSVAPARHGS